MKQFLRCLLSIALLIVSAAITADCGQSCNNLDCFTNVNACSDTCNNCTACHSILIPRSTGANVVREFNQQNYRYDLQGTWGTFALDFEWQRSFKEDKIAKCLFGGRDCLGFVGSSVIGRQTTDLIADNFGLSPFSSAALQFKPRIEHFIIDANLQVSFDHWCNGAFLRINTPFDYTRWDLRASCIDTCSITSACSPCSTGCSTGCSIGCSLGCSNNCSNNCNSCCVVPTCSTVTTPFNAGCVGTIAQGPITGADSLQTALSGDFTFGTMQTPWNYGRFVFCRQKEHKLADIDVILGWNFRNCEDYHVGIGIQAVAPTGTKIDACHARTFFNPVVGNGRHWELGGFFSAHAQLWHCDERSFNVYVEGNVTHMFRNHQVRSFDFADRGCFSRYMLLKEFIQQPNGAYLANGNLINAINYNTRFADISVSVKGDALIQFIYNSCRWAAGIGYNIYGHSCETICVKDGFVDPTLRGRYFGIKGCSPVEVAGAVTAVAGTTVTAAATSVTGLGTAGSVAGGIFLTATNSNATATSCGITDHAQPLSVASTGGTAGAIFANTCANIGLIAGIPAIGTPVASITAANISSLTALTITVAGTAITATGFSPAPAILTGTSEDLDINSGRAPRQLSHKIFGHIDYTWKDNCWLPFVSIIGEAEFSQSNDCCVVNQGGLILKGGFTF